MLNQYAMQRMQNLFGYGQSSQWAASATLWHIATRHEFMQVNFITAILIWKQLSTPQFETWCELYVPIIDSFSEENTQ